MSIFQSLFLALLIQIFHYVEDINATMYGERLKEINDQKDLLTWQPVVHNVFANRDENELKRFLGIHPDKMQNAKAMGGKAKHEVKKPDKSHSGRGHFGSSKGRWRNLSRYLSEYWNHGSNQRDSGDWRNNTKGIWKWHKNSSHHASYAAHNGSKTSRDNGNNHAFETSGSHHHHIRVKRDLPIKFDWRDYTDCKSLEDIRYQECGDCWSVASASVMSDRYCLWTHQNRIFSARQLTTCVYVGEGGCNGGWPLDAMKMYKNQGVATGGDPTIQDELTGCLPYPKILTDHIQCPKTCDDAATFDSAKAKDYYEITSKNVTEIMEEIFNYGPVVAIFEVFDDFGYMGEGVYQHVAGNSQGYHAVRLLGWGVENNVPYWIAANSWGSHWGDKGYFKILRGSNHCDIESWITSVFPAEAYLHG